MNCNTPGMLSLFYYIKIAMNIIFIAAPILLIVLGTIDFLSATTASDEKKMRKAIDTFIKRLVICVVILILPLLINIVMSVVNVKSYKECFANATKVNIEKLDKEFQAKKKLEEEELRKKIEDAATQIPTNPGTGTGTGTGYEGGEYVASPTRTGLLNVARAQVGVGENPDGSNNVKYNTWYYGRAVSGDAYPWCAVFVSWVAKEAGVMGTAIPKYASCRRGVAWFKEQGRWQGKTYTPAPGDIIFYDWDLDGSSDHTGIVEYVDGSGIHTIEGNSSNKVIKGTVKNNKNILGFGVPNY